MIRDMTSVPDRARVRLTGISSRAYEHPADRSALVALRKLTGFDTLLRKLFGLFNERALRLTYLAGAVKVSERQFPHIHELVRDGAYILDLPEVPECSSSQTPLVNAMALGRDKPFIVITTGLVNLYDAEELRCGHRARARAHPVRARGVPDHAADPHRGWPRGSRGCRSATSACTAIIWGLEEWFRKSELSCDRAGLLAGQDVDAARRALMKLAGGAQLSELNPDAFREQAHEYDAVPDLRDSVLKILQLQGNTHPFAVVRFAELDYWATTASTSGSSAGTTRAGTPTATASVERRGAQRGQVLPGVLEPVRGPADRHLPRRRGDAAAGRRRAVRPAAATAAAVATATTTTERSRARAYGVPGRRERCLSWLDSRRACPIGG